MSTTERLNFKSAGAVRTGRIPVHGHIAQHREQLRAAKLKAERPLFQGLIPTNGVHVSETEYPKGFYVARYDAQGFTSESGWFETRAKADAYADQLEARS